MRRITVATVVCCVLLGILPARAELIEYDDAADSLLAATLIGSNDATGWNDPTIHTGDLFIYRYHILIAIKDTSTIQSLFSEYTLDSAHLSLVTSAVFGAPGDLTLHYIYRDSTGVGVYPAFDDSRSFYCRSQWYERKGALPEGCPDPIDWETPGATGATDYDSIPFATVTSPTAGQRYDIDVTQWIAGIVAGDPSRSNGIMLLASGEDGSGADYISIHNIHPFYTGNDQLILRIWRSQPSTGQPHRAWIDSPDQLK